MKARHTHPLAGKDGSQQLELPEALTHVLDECRVVLPGIQALFGFQMIAVFSEAFHQRLTLGEQKLHIATIALVVVAIALLMAPAAIHRQAEPKTASDRFLRLATRLMLAAMLPLALANSAGVFLVTQMVWHDPVFSCSLSGALLVLLTGSWFALPAIYRRRSAPV